jgi:hypothetical protein
MSNGTGPLPPPPCLAGAELLAGPRDLDARLEAVREQGRGPGSGPTLMNPLLPAPWSGQCLGYEKCARDLLYTLESYLATRPDLYETGGVEGAGGMEEGGEGTGEGMGGGTWEEGMGGGTGPGEELGTEEGGTSPVEGTGLMVRKSHPRENLSTPLRDDMEAAAGDAESPPREDMGAPAGDFDSPPSSPRLSSNPRGGEPAFWRRMYRAAVLRVHPDRCPDRYAHAWFDAVHQGYAGGAYAPLVALAAHLRVPLRSAGEAAYVRRHWKVRLAAARRRLDALRAGAAMQLWGKDTV